MHKPHLVQAIFWLFYFYLHHKQIHLDCINLSCNKAFKMEREITVCVRVLAVHSGGWHSPPSLPLRCPLWPTLPAAGLQAHTRGRPQGTTPTAATTEWGWAVLWVSITPCLPHRVATSTIVAVKRLTIMLSWCHQGDKAGVIRGDHNLTPACLHTHRAINYPIKLPPALIKMWKWRALDESTWLICHTIWLIPEIGTALRIIVSLS